MHFWDKSSASAVLWLTENILCGLFCCLSSLEWSFGLLGHVQSLPWVLFWFIHWFIIIFISTDTSMLLPCFPVFLFMLTLTPDLLHTLGNHIIYIFFKYTFLFLSQFSIFSHFSFHVMCYCACTGSNCRSFNASSVDTTMSWCCLQWKRWNFTSECSLNTDQSAESSRLHWVSPTTSQNDTHHNALRYHNWITIETVGNVWERDLAGQGEREWIYSISFNLFSSSLHFCPFGAS